MALTMKLIYEAFWMKFSLYLFSHVIVDQFFFVKFLSRRVQPSNELAVDAIRL